MNNKPCENRDCPIGAWDNVGHHCKLIKPGLIHHCTGYHSNKPLKMPELGKGYRFKSRPCIKHIVTGIDTDSPAACINNEWPTLEDFWMDWEEIN